MGRKKRFEWRVQLSYIKVIDLMERGKEWKIKTQKYLGSGSL
jgi:hypothetical protein